MLCDLLSFCTAKEERGKGKRWSLHVAVRVRAFALGEGPGHECAATPMVVGSAHTLLPDIGQNERERDEQWTGDANVTLCGIYWDG
jgi:hypothetical protein